MKNIEKPIAIYIPEIMKKCFGKAFRTNKQSNKNLEETFIERFIVSTQREDTQQHRLVIEELRSTKKSWEYRPSLAEEEIEI